jgi:hypothetical protein
MDLTQLKRIGLITCDEVNPLSLNPIIAEVPTSFSTTSLYIAAPGLRASNIAAPVVVGAAERALVLAIYVSAENGPTILLENIYDVFGDGRDRPCGSFNPNLAEVDTARAHCFG